MPTQSNIPLALAYDDVLLVPQRSRIKHRADTNTATYLTSKIKLALPFLSANMDTVTESQMAIAMARAGGLGVIHRFMTIKDQVKEVDKVARFEGFFIDNPYTTHPDKPVRHIIENIALNGVSSYLVVDQKNKLLGLVSRRDVIFETDHSQKVSQVMTPLKSLITVPPGTTKDKAKKLFAKYKIEKLPVIKRDGTLAGLITAKSIENYELQPLATKDELGRLRCGAAVGVVGDYLERAGALLTAGADVLVVDVAHGQNAASLEAIAALRKTYHQAQIIGGNVATPQGVKDLIKAGVDAVKVGIGPGGICSTRMVTGVGVPQFTAVMPLFLHTRRENQQLLNNSALPTAAPTTLAISPRPWPPALPPSCWLVGLLAPTRVQVRLSSATTANLRFTAAQLLSAHRWIGVRAPVRSKTG